MGLLDGDVENPQSKLMRYMMSGMVFALLLSLGVWYVFRYHTEKRTIGSFFEAVVAGDMQRAYEIWKPASSYTFENFVADWDEKGFYGPVKSYNIELAQMPENASGVIVVVAVSPFESFPTTREMEKHPRIKEVYLWVERSDQSISYAPSPPRRRTFFGR